MQPNPPEPTKGIKATAMMSGHTKMAMYSVVFFEMAAVVGSGLTWHWLIGVFAGLLCSGFNLMVMRSWDSDERTKYYAAMKQESTKGSFAITQPPPGGVVIE